LEEDSETICPVCDSDIPHDQEKCPICGADLSLFDQDIDLEDDISQESIEKVMDMVLDDEGIDQIDGPSDLDSIEDELGQEEIQEEEEEEDDDEIQNELIEDLKDLGLSDDDLEEEKKEPEDTEEDTEENIERIITFECPICESEVSEDASECPSCGVIFEEEEDEEIEEEVVDEKKEELEKDISSVAEELDDIHGDFEELDSILEQQMESSETDLQERVHSLEEKIGRLRRSNIVLDEIKSDLNKVKNALEDEDEEKANGLVERAEDRVGFALDIRERVERCRNYIEWISQKSDTSNLEEWIEDILRGCEIGEYRVASKKADEVEQDIKEVAEDMGMKKGKELKRYIEKKEKSVKEKLSEIDDLNVDVDTGDIEEYVDNSSIEMEVGDLIESFHSIMNANRTAETVHDISKKIVEAEDHIERLKEKEREYEEYSDDLEEAKERFKRGDISGGEDKVEGTIDDLKKKLGEKEEKVEKKKKEETVEKKGGKNLFKEIQQKIPRTKELLKRSKNFGIDIEGGKELIKEAVEKTKQNDYEDAIQSLRDCEEFFQRKLDKKIEDELNQMEESSIDGMQELKERIEKYRDKGDYKKIRELIEKKKRGGEKESERDEEDLEPFKEELSRIEDTISMAEKLELDFPEARGLIEKARSKCEKGEIGGLQRLIEKIENKAFRQLANALKDDIKEARDELKKAKIQGADISRPVKLLKETNNARKSGDLKESIEYFKEYKKNMEDIRADL